MSNSSQNLDEQGYYLQAEVLSREDSVNRTDQNGLIVFPRTSQT